MKSPYIALAWMALASVTTASVQARPVAEPRHSSRHHKIMEITAEPKVRIRGDADREGLSPLEFARWMKAHPRLSYRQPPSLLLASSPTRMLNRSAISFKAADANGDGRISAAELADFVDPFAPRRTFSPSV